MDVFRVRDQLINDYRDFTSSFVDVRDERVRAHVERLVELGHQWPEPMLSLNPTFMPGGTVDDLAREGLITRRTAEIFRLRLSPDDAAGQALRLHRHQRTAIELARAGHSYVLTTGTGSGKSLAYLVPIVDRVLRAHETGNYRPGIKAIIVYPMNALANSQLHEMDKFLRFGSTDRKPPVSYERYTGQEDQDRREEILRDPPDILLTNYVMLELVLTRVRERERLIKAAQGLWFLVLDELHTYRGRQGADVAYLVRRTRDACAASHLQCVGTSATMTTKGSVSEQRAEVARVASRLFGTAVSPEHVIGESLARAVKASGVVGPELLASLRRWSAGTVPADYTELVNDPLAAWVETMFGLADVGGELTRPREPRTVSAVAHKLSGLTGVGEEECAAAIRAVLQTGASIVDPTTGRPIFAFRLHQFLSKGDNVYVTLEPPATRYITTRYQPFSPNSTDTERKVLFPLAFCRECGQEYLSARRVADVFEPRQDNDIATDSDGYLYVSDDLPWPESPEVAISDGRLPYSWTVLADDGGTVLAPNKEKYLPEAIHVAVDGRHVPPGQGLLAAWVASPFRFCIRCRVSYERRGGGKDFAQLAKLSAEGRSSALSVVGASIVRALRDSGLEKQARKLLGFVDNRQDASLQAGHFNDFVQVVQLRGALYRALAKEPDGLTHERVAQRVTEELGLDMTDFAKAPDAKYALRDEAWRALREVVNYRLYQDLERGWRVTMPNLEQTGLLRIEYLSLNELCADQAAWAGVHPLLRDDDPKHRYEVAATLLDELRRNLAIDVRCLTEPGFDEIRRLSMQHLTETWGLGPREAASEAQTAYPRPSGKRSPRSHLHLSGRGAFGKYLVREYGSACTVADAQEVIRSLLEVLADAGIVRRVSAKEDDGGYRLSASALLWRAGTGEHGAEDRVRRTLAADTEARVNTFFRDLYREQSHLLVGMRAKEHTAQVSPLDREQREMEFRDGDLPMLFCSSTMELGVDIAALNAVALRNVPPTPANYAQRAGRAGRSGQPALVVTYCSTGNSHDQYYFNRRGEMVSGSVVAPRLDLANEDLIRSHVHAIWLAETGVELPGSLAKVVDTGGERPTLEILPDIQKKLNDPAAQARAIERSNAMLSADLGEVTSAPWWRPTWVTDVVQRAPRSFAEALGRWVELYKAARTEFETQTVRSVNTGVSARDREEAHRRANDARVQLLLLSNEDSDDFQTDFYTYRYLAAEGFLPGYSFPRLPVAAYVPGLSGRREGEYIHRPRFIGISEFGPGALIYHEGSRYMVRSVQLPPAQPGQDGVVTSSARRCRECGYLHEDKPGIDVCEECGATLGPITRSLLRLLTVRTVRRERISSDEEERRRSGYEIETSYRFHHHYGSRPGSLRARVRGADGSILLELTYGDAATVRRANLGLSRRKERNQVGYWLDTTTGEWLSETKAEAMTSDEQELGEAARARQKVKVIPYVEDRRNILVLRLARKVEPAVGVTLMYALERAMEAVFQLEDTELSSEPLPDEERHGRMLFIESAEGGAGALRRMVAEPRLMAEVAHKALEIAHFDPETGEDRGGELTDEVGQVTRCVQGCYECLLSYSNQPQHRVIDRHLVVDLLRALRTATTEPSTTEPSSVVGPAPASGPASGAVAEFLEWLAAAGHRAPDAVCSAVPGTTATPDLTYRDVATAVFIDEPGVEPGSGRDRSAEESLLDAGWTPIRITAGQWQQAVEQHPRIFGAHRPDAV